MKRPTSSSGFCVADRPMRWGSRSCSAASRSSVSARCEPRLVAATAWISSRMIASTPVRISRAPLESMRYSDSGVVMRMSGGWRRIAARSLCGVSPVRTPTVRSARRSRAAARAGCGRCRRRAPSAARRRRGACGRRARERAGRAPQRNAASVLPEPVGAVMSVCSPVAIAGQACAWTSVGPSKAEANQSRTAGVNCDSGTSAQASRQLRPVSVRNATETEAPPGLRAAGHAGLWSRA